jgi:hypothetical protein
MHPPTSFSLLSTGRLWEKARGCTCLGSVIVLSVVENKRRICYRVSVDEGRKRVLLIAAAILAARKLSQLDPGKRAPVTVAVITDAVHWAERLLEEIDQRWPSFK